MSKWQQIETAPKTDDDVLLCFSNGDIEVAYWRDDAQGWDGAVGWIKEQPTHWMPLPPPPTKQDITDNSVVGPRPSMP